LYALTARTGWVYSEMMRGATMGKNLVVMDLSADESAA
jgi:hypothetical protein